MQLDDMHEFDVILGMDWLAEYQAHVDCAAVEIRGNGQKPVEVNLLLLSVSFLLLRPYAV